MVDHKLIQTSLHLPQLTPPKPHAAADGPLREPELSSEAAAAAATRSDKDIATALGTVKNSTEAPSSVQEKEVAKQSDKASEEARFTDLEARFAALKKK